MEFVGKRVDRIDALVYLRAPADYAASAFQQRVQKSLARFVPAELVPPYRERAERWAATLGREPQYVPFDRAAFRDGDLLVDFADRLGLDRDWLRRHARRTNESLSAEATAVLFALRRADGQAARFGPGARINGRLVGELRSFGARRFAIDPAAIEPVLAARREEMAWVEERMGRPFPPPRRDGAVLFASDADVLALAAAQERDLARHLARGAFAGPPEGEGVLGLLRGLRARIAADEARLAAAGGAA